MGRPLLEFLMPWRRSRSGPGAPMSCEEVGKILQHYLDHHLHDGLDPVRAGRLAEHLEECRRCGLEAETYQRIKESLAARRDPLPDEALARLRAFGERIARGDEPEER